MKQAHTSTGFVTAEATISGQCLELVPYFAMHLTRTGERGAAELEPILRTFARLQLFRW
jgi:hypothetical protein